MPWPDSARRLPPSIRAADSGADTHIEAMTETRKNLVGLSREELAAEVAAMGEAPFRARQLWHWLYHRGATDFAAMTTLAKDFRAKLAERHDLARPVKTRAQISEDGTRKWLLA